MIHDDDCVPIAFKLKGVGIGHSNTGQRRSFEQDGLFETDLLSKLERKMCLRKFKSRFVHSPTEIRCFFETIKAKAMRPLETEHHCCNKVLLLLDRLHNCLSAEQMSDRYHIGCKTAYDHCSDIVHAILVHSEDKNVITFPTKPERKIMVNILKRKTLPCPSALFAVDGSDTRCTSRHIMERLSHKYK